MPEAIDPSAWASALGIGGGWLVAVLLGLFVVRQLSTGKWVTLRQLERELAQAHLNAEILQTIAHEADARADTDRETTRALLAAANVSVRSVQLLAQQLPEQLPQAAGEGT